MLPAILYTPMRTAKTLPAACALLLCAALISAAQETEAGRQFDAAATYLNSGNTTLAEPLLEKAAQLAGREGNYPFESFIMLQHSKVLNNQRRLRESTAKADMAYALMQKYGPDNDKVKMGCDTANVIFANGDFGKGLARAEEALAQARKQKYQYGETAALQILSNFHLNMGEFGEALATYRKAIPAAIKSGDKNLLRGIYRMNGVLSDEIGDPRGAMRWYLAANNVKTASQDDYWNLKNDIAAAFMNLGLYDKAEKEFQDCIRNPASSSQGDAFVNLAENYMLAGKTTEACAIYAKTPNMPGRLLCMLQAGNWAQAKPLANNMVVEAEKYRARNTLPASYTLAGMTHEMAGDYQTAQSYYEKGRDNMERIRQSLPMDKRLYYLSGHDWPIPRLESYEGLVRTAAIVEGPEAAFYNSEFTKGRIFSEAFSAKRKEAGRLPPELANAEKSVATALNAAFSKAQLHFRAGRTIEYTTAMESYFAEKKKLEALVIRIRKINPQYAAAAYPDPIKAENVALAPDEVLVEYEVMRPYSKIFAIRQGKVIFTADIKLGRPALEKLVSGYMCGFDNISKGEAMARIDMSKGLELYRLLLQPLVTAKDPSGKPLINPRQDKLIIAPDEILGLVPFEGLPVFLPAREARPDAAHGAAPVGVRYAGDSLDITYTQSATALTVKRNLRRQEQTALKDALVLADPILSAQDSRLRGKMKEWITMGIGGERAGENANREAGDLLTAMMPRLGKTALLADHIKSQIFNSSTTLVLTGFDATKKRFIQAAPGTFRYLVFATHGALGGMVDGISEPAMILTPVPGKPISDWFLTLSDVYTLRLNANLAILTACHTGEGKKMAGEGIMGLGRAFGYAGAQAVLASLWSVEEQSATMLAERVLYGMSKGLDKRAALRQARADLRKSGFEHPFYWASFIMME